MKVENEAKQVRRKRVSLHPCSGDCVYCVGYKVFPHVLSAAQQEQEYRTWGLDDIAPAV